MNGEMVGWPSILASLGVAFGCGLLVGLEREQSALVKGRARFGGVRTFSLIGLLGAIAGLLMEPLGWWATALVLVVAAVPVVASAIQGLGKEEGKGFTTEMGALAVLFLGLMASTPLAEVDQFERWGLIAAASLATLTVLSLREPLHQLAQRISSADIYATAKLGVLLVIVLPLLPRRAVGPVSWFNPFEVGLMVTLIATIGFVGYVAVRLVGARRGLTLTGLVGGLVSSTAVTLNFSGRAKESPSLVPLAALGIVLASTIMFPRMLLLVAVVDRDLLPAAAWPLGAMGAVGVVATGLVYLRHRDDTGGPSAEVGVKNPFSLEQAFKFGALYLAILAVTDLALDLYGTPGLFVSAILAGITDVDAITLSISRLQRDGLEIRSAQLALFLAAGSNTLVKAGLATALGGRALGLRVAGIFLPMLLAGAAAVALHIGD